MLLLAESKWFLISELFAFLSIPCSLCVRLFTRLFLFQKGFFRCNSAGLAPVFGTKFGQVFTFLGFPGLLWLFFFLCFGLLLAACNPASLFRLFLDVISLKDTTSVYLRTNFMYIQ